MTELISPNLHDLCGLLFVNKFHNLERGQWFVGAGAGRRWLVCAFLYPDGIPEELFSIGASELGSALERVGSDAFAFDDAVSGLLKYSLVRRDPTTGTLEIRRPSAGCLEAGD